jgi:hypothetical protein
VRSLAFHRRDKVVVARTSPRHGPRLASLCSEGC